MTTLMSRAALILVVLGTAVTVTGSPAGAHETRTVGRYQLVVGWADEPAHSSTKNSVQVLITEIESGLPVTDVTGLLGVEVVRGDQNTTLPLDPNFGVGLGGRPGEYRAPLTPTRPGVYQFRVTGSIRGQIVDESFPENDVEDTSRIAFPTKDPSPSELATRLERETDRLRDAASSARVAAIVAGAVAIVALVMAALGWRAASRTSVGDGPTPTEDDALLPSGSDR